MQLGTTAAGVASAAPAADRNDAHKTGDNVDETPPVQPLLPPPRGLGRTALPSASHVEKEIHFATWTVGKSKLADAIGAMNTIRKFDCIASTELLHPFECGH